MSRFGKVFGNLGSDLKGLDIGSVNKLGKNLDLNPGLGKTLGKNLDPGLGKTLGNDLDPSLGKKLGNDLDPSLGKNLDPNLGKTADNLGKGKKSWTPSQKAAAAAAVVGTGITVDMYLNASDRADESNKTPRTITKVESDQGKLNIYFSPVLAILKTDSITINGSKTDPSIDGPQEILSVVSDSQIVINGKSLKANTPGGTISVTTTVGNQLSSSVSSGGEAVGNTIGGGLGGITSGLFSGIFGDNFNMDYIKWGCGILCCLIICIIIMSFVSKMNPVPLDH